MKSPFLDRSSISFITRRTWSPSGRVENTLGLTHKSKGFLKRVMAGSSRSDHFSSEPTDHDWGKTADFRFAYRNYSLPLRVSRKRAPRQRSKYILTESGPRHSSTPSSRAWS